MMYRVRSVSIFSVLIAAAMSANAATLTVTTTGDAGDGSLRQAILEANTSVGVPDTIVFDIPVNDPGHVYYMEDLQSGLPGIVTQTTEADDANLNNPDLLYPRSWYRISPATPLPPITDPVVIDGYTQGQGTPVTTDDATPNSGTIEQGLNTVLRIELYGAGAGFAANGLFFNTGSDGSEVRGLAIRDFSGSDGQPGHGILVLSDDTRIEGNFLGPGVDGLTRSNNTHGLAVVGDNNAIGGTSPGSRNLVSANNRYGMIFGGGASGNVIQGNLIGLSRTGVAGAGNFRDGILILDAPNNTVGGLVADARNIVSGNGFGGISILNAPSSGNVVQGNYVGVDITGGVDIGNSFHGVLLLDAPGNTVGGTDPGAGNVSAGNGFGGVTVERSGNSVVQGNYLGTDPTGALAIPNDFSGVVVVDSSNNTIGGSEAGANTIAFNAKDGVIVSQNSVSNLVRSNSIYSNGALGIDLSVVLNPNATGDGVTSNDAGDPDTGTNNLQNFPDLVSAEISGTLNITYSVDSVSPNSAFPLTIEFFIADAAGQEGKTIIGSDLYNQGDGQKVAMISTKGTVGPGTQILATATDADGNTSEFSSSVAVGGETSQTIFVVNSTGAGCDQNLIDGICDSGNLVNGEPECTLCAAIEEANVKPNQSPDALDEIRFDIPANDSGHLFYQDDGGSGVTLTNVTTTAEPSDASIPNLDPDWPQSWYSIDLLSALPPVTDPVVIDGYTQSGASENTNPVGQGLNTVIKIELNGEIAGQVDEGLLRIAAGDSVLKGLVINRSDGAKVYLDSSGDNRIEGCFLGPDVSGTEGFPPPGGATAIIPRSGVFVLSGDNLIGGLAPAARNLISGNIRAGDSGIAIQGSGSRGTIVEGNLIGTDRTGTQAIPNRDRGVFIDRSFGNTVGGPTDGAANVISGNENWGINILVFGSNPTTDNLIEGNVIGADVTGTQPLGNGADGVSIEGATGNLVVENTIAFNAGAGIFVEEISQQSGFSNGLIRNSIFSNTSLGIDLGLTFDGENLETPDQVNFPQDEGDPDVGANNVQNFPRITGVDVTKGGPTSVTGFFRSAPNSQYRIEFFASEERHPTGFGEGQFFLGDYDLTTDANGAHDFTAPVGAIPSGYEFVTCTATDLNDRGSGPANDTSEFCGAFPVQGCGFTVTNTADSGLGSLRDAIFCSNLIPGIDTIDFAIPGAGPHLVQPNTPLPYFRDSVTIDGYTQGSQTPGDPSDDATPNTNPIYQGLNTVLKIQIDGTNAGNNASGLILLAGESLVRGLSVTGFDGTGIVLQANGNNSVTGNFIGVAPDGSPNENDVGVFIVSSLGTTLGGPDPGDRNLISANRLSGIEILGGDSGLEAADTLVQGNVIGADASATQPMGNDVGLEIDASIVSILENIVAFNTDAGMLVFGQEVSILRNSLFLNDELGIDLDEDGVTTNDVPPASDPPDQDTGANNLQNFPELTSRTDAGTTTIMGTLRSVPNTDFRIEFFSNLITDLSGFGEGQSYLGFVNVTTNPAGIAPIAFDAGILVPEEQSVTSTATRRDGTGNPIETSEFSARIGAVACSTVVTTANDGGIGSLREAIQCANFNSGVDTISFDIPGPGPHKILLEAATTRDIRSRRHRRVHSRRRHTGSLRRRNTEFGPERV
jgi:hypothetical protein